MAPRTCASGHEMTPENAMMRGTRIRGCRECNRVKSRGRRERRAAAEGKTVRLAELVSIKSGRRIDISTYESHIERSEGCWLWTGTTDEGGYGRVGGHSGAHQIAYEIAYGAIPEGLEIDHLCFVTNCVNPAHLEAVTHDENMRRRAERQTHCKRGHEFTAENIIRQGADGRGRKCRTCHNACMRRTRAPLARESWAPEAELTATSLAEVAGAVTA